MAAAWERIKHLDIPAVPADQHFGLSGPAFYLGPNGDDAADGSREHPWKTLPHAAANLKPGTVIYLMAGAYYGPVEIRTKATEQSPAALRAKKGSSLYSACPGAKEGIKVEA